MTEESHEPHDTQAEEAANAERANAERQKRIVEESDFKAVMGRKEGRRLMWRLLSMTGLFANPFIPGRDGQTEFHCGKQNIGQQLMAEIHSLCPERYHEMVKEHQQDERSSKRS